MAGDQYEPPPGLTEEELRRWKQWRKFTWLPQDIVITRPGDGKRSGKDTDGVRDQEHPGDVEAR